MKKVIYNYDNLSEDKIDEAVVREYKKIIQKEKQGIIFNKSIV